MRLCTIASDGYEEAAVGLSNGVISISQINNVTGEVFPNKLESLIDLNLTKKLNEVVENYALEPTILFPAVKFAPLMRKPSKVWGIGLNYKNSLDYVNVDIPPEPSLFMKPNSSIIGYKDIVELPPQSKYVIAEAELGVVIGKECKFLQESEAEDVIFGYTTLFDIVANGILAVNPRFLARAKSFDTFLSIGPWLVSKDEIGGLETIKIKSILNDQLAISDVVNNMTYSPFYVVAYLSNVFTLRPGDIICMGTPKPVEINCGDKIECEIDKVGELINFVVSSTMESRI